MFITFPNRYFKKTSFTYLKRVSSLINDVFDYLITFRMRTLHKIYLAFKNEVFLHFFSRGNTDYSAAIYCYKFKIVIIFNASSMIG